MNNLINFFVKHVSWFVLAIYVVVSCALLFNNNPYQQNVYLTSANGISSSVYEAFSAITSYFNLRTINDELQQRNADLEMQVVDLKAQLNNYREAMPDTTHVQPVFKQFDYVVAHVISNSVAQPYNYITINRGSADGIEPEMGVVDHNGVVGIVNAVAPHSARIISLLNPYAKISCKVRRNNLFGTLVWDGRDPYHCVLQELPRQGKYLRGDTIITAGYSAVFPEGIIVGFVERKLADQPDGSAQLQVRLSTNFTQLSTVRAIKNKVRVEIKSLEDADINKQDNIVTKRKQEKLKAQQDSIKKLNKAKNSKKK